MQGVAWLLSVVVIGINMFFVVEYLVRFLSLLFVIIMADQCQ